MDNTTTTPPAAETPAAPQDPATPASTPPATPPADSSTPTEQPKKGKMLHWILLGLGLLLAIAGGIYYYMNMMGGSATSQTPSPTPEAVVEEVTPTLPPVTETPAVSVSPSVKPSGTVTPSVSPTGPTGMTSPTPTP